MLPDANQPAEGDAASPDATRPEVVHPGLSLEQLNAWRQEDTSWARWRYDSAIDEEYDDGNQFSEEDRAALQAAGIPMVVCNRIKRLINDVVGLQESNMTDFKLTSEDVNQQDAVDALSAKLKVAERMSGADRACLDAFKSLARAGIGWVEVGRETNPFKYGLRCRTVPWREMFWPRSAREPDLSDASRIRRLRFYPLDVLFMAFPGKEAEIRAAAWNSEKYRNWVEPNRQERDYAKNLGRDLPLGWGALNDEQRSMRCIEEVWYPVMIEGPVVKMANGQVIAYDKVKTKKLVQLALEADMAELIENAVYPRWRQSFWIADRRLEDRWSPLPFEGCPYVPFWAYREAMTGVPYGLIRVMRSLQDAINTLEAKMMFSINAKQTKMKEGAASIENIQAQVGKKNGIIVVKTGYQLSDVQIDDHIALNEQHFKLYQDLCAQLDAISGVAGLNPGGMTSGKPRSGVLADQMTMRAMASLGEISANYRTARLLVGEKLMALTREDLAQAGTEGTTVEIKGRDGIKRSVRLHEHRQLSDGSYFISNDVELLKANAVLEEVPHTATFRAQQFEQISSILQSMPPEAVDVRAAMLANLVECSDLPHAADDAQMLREKAGLVPPSTPEAQAAAQQKQQEAEQQRQLAVEEVMAKIDHNKAKANKDNASAERLQIESQQLAAGTHASQQTPPATPEDPTATLLDRMKTAEQIAQIRAKTAKTMHETVGADLENQATARAQQAPVRW